VNLELKKLWEEPHISMNSELDAYEPSKSQLNISTPAPWNYALIPQQENTDPESNSQGYATQNLFLFIQPPTFEMILTFPPQHVQTHSSP
jgi:hypothetical protein